MPDASFCHGQFIPERPTLSAYPPAVPFQLIYIRHRYYEKSSSGSMVFGMGLDTNEGAQPLIGSLTFRVVIAGKVESNIRDRF